MTAAEERQQIGKIVEARMTKLGISVPVLAEKADVDATTIRALLRGRRWPRVETREKIGRVLGWELGDVARIAVEHEFPLAAVPTQDLLDELCRRAGRWDV